MVVWSEASALTLVALIMGFHPTAVFVVALRAIN